MTEKLYLQRKNELLKSIWPLGLPANNWTEPPLWQDISKRWCAEVVQPRNMTRLVEELLRDRDPEADGTIASFFLEARDAAGNWQEVCESQGWRECEPLIDELSKPGRHTLRLTRLLNLVFDACNTDELANPDEVLFYWVRSVPRWEGGAIGTHKELLGICETGEDRAEGRRLMEAGVRKHTESEVTYTLGWVHEWGDTLKFSDDWDGENPDLPVCDLASLGRLYVDRFVSMEELLKCSTDMLNAWVRSEWLEPHGFVNFEDCAWSSLTDWEELAREKGLDALVVSPEVASWYSISEDAGLHLKALGELVAETPCGYFFGRTSGGSSLWGEPEIQQAMIRSGYLRNVPPLGLLNADPRKLPRVEVTLEATEWYPFRVCGYRELHDQELAELILDPGARHEWEVLWALPIEHPELGLVRSFRVARKLAYTGGND